MNGNDYYDEFRTNLKMMSDNELIDRFNKEVRNTGWGHARAIFIRALQDTFDDRNFDYSEIGNVSKPSFKYKLALKGKKLTFANKG